MESSIYSIEIGYLLVDVIMKNLEQIKFFFLPRNIENRIAEKVYFYLLHSLCELAYLSYNFYKVAQTIERLTFIDYHQ